VRGGRLKLDYVSDEPLKWAHLVEFQSRVAARRQALAAGVPEDVIEWRVQSGRWLRLQRGVYATFTGKPSREARLWAALLRAGPGAVLSHETAAELHGLTSTPSTKIHITVPHRHNPVRTRKIPGVIIHRARRIAADPQPPWQLRRTRVADTVLDLVGAAKTFDDAYGWICRGVGRQLTGPRQLREALAARKKIRWRVLLTEALDDAAEGVDSPLERRYVHGVERAHGLPQARRQYRVLHGGRNKYLDNLYEEYQVCVELDGAAAHPADERWRDTSRDNTNLAAGKETLRYGWPGVTVHRCESAIQLAAVLRRNGWQGNLRPCGPACPVAVTP
jgi:hypothetical protein